MEPSTIAKIIVNTPYMTPAQGARIFHFIRSHGFRNILELGFAHGVSTCYMAAALPDTGGSVVTIDLEHAKYNKPNIEELLEKTKLRSRVTIWYEPTSYLWRLMKFLEQDEPPKFDFCYFDGAHSWFIDGFAFLLVDRILKPNGWIVFDDLDWSYAKSQTLKSSDFVKNMSEEERTTPQVRKIYELLVKRHHSYTDFRVEDGWAYARKIAENEEPPVVKREIIIKDPFFFRKRILGRLRSIFRV